MISIITINYNGAAVTAQLLNSLSAVGFSGEVIVVDNGSAQNEAEILSRDFGWVRVIRSDVNLGFAGGNNLGIAEARGEYIMLLNNDTTVTENFEQPIKNFFATHPQAGAISPKIRFEYAPNVIQFAGYTPLSSITLRNSLIGFRQTDNGQYPTARTPYAHGAAMVVRRKVIEQVGPMPECYFLYYEELDWCESIRRHGWEIWYVAQAVVYHKESWSTGRNSPIKSYYITRNRLLFATRNTTGVNRVLSIIYQLAIATPVNTLRHMLRGETLQARAIIKGVRDYVTHH